MRLDELVSADFSAHLNTTFVICPEGAETVAAELIDVSEVGERASGRTPFSIVLRTPLRPVLPQSIYTIEHPHLGTLAIFIVPIGPDAVGMRYEAVFG